MNGKNKSVDFEKDVHTEHCCVIHHCKYGEDATCSVVTKRKPQSFICELCENDGIHDMDDLRLVTTGIKQTCPYCQHTLP